MTNNEFSGTLAELTSGEREFKELGDFALNVLALPFPNLSCKRVFLQ